MQLQDASADGPLILFDGVCHLCQGFVQFILARDPKAQFRFASLQSPIARHLLAACGAEAQDLNSVVLMAEGRAYTKSDAALRIAARLSGPWPVLKAFLLVPRPIRDWVYDRVAGNRYRWFGKSSACLIPTPELRHRFLS